MFGIVVGWFFCVYAVAKSILKKEENE